MTKLETTRKKTGGRKKGTPNKTTAAAKQIIAETAGRLGGADRMVEWAKESPDNERIFWSQMYVKLVPYQVNGPGDDGEHIIRSYGWLPPQE
ncbi:MAG: hypothetical protein AAFR21_11565 [Pseudomonadota bacterium]